MTLPNIPDRFLKPMVYALIAMQGVDIVTTLMLLSVVEGLNEANPLMAALLEVHTVVFVIGKMLMVFPFIYLLWWMRSFKMAQYGIVLATIPYLLLMVYHAWGMIVIFG